MNLFEALNLIYSSRTINFVNDIDENVHPVVLNLMLSRNHEISHWTKHLNKYVYVLDTKQFAALAWSFIQPKRRAPFTHKVAVEEETSHYDFLFAKVRARFQISNNDWKYCREMFLEHIKENTKEYLVFYGCPKKDWNILGLDFEESKDMNMVEIKEGLDKWS